MKHATISEVAARAGVSSATVSRVLNDTGPVARETRARVERAIQELSFEPNAVARSLRTAETRTIVFLLPDVGNPFFPDLVRGAQHAAMERGYTLWIANTAGELIQELAHVRAVRQMQIDGLIATGLLSPPEEFRQLIGRQIPVVTVDRVAPMRGVPLIRIDHRKGAREATRHLLALGHRRIAHIAEPQHHPVAAYRIGGYLDAMRQAELTELVRVVPGDGTPEGGARAMGSLLEATAPPTAVFAADDLMAIGALSEAFRRGLTVPSDMSVIGFDGIGIGAYTSPPLTTIRQPTYEMGRRAVELVVEAIAEKTRPRPQDVVLELELVVRGSTAPPRDSSSGPAEDRGIPAAAERHASMPDRSSP